MSQLTINTSRFGEVSVEQKNVIHFTAPILGFETVHEYVLLDHMENSPFRWLQATTQPDLAFVVTNPKFFGIPYEFALPDDAVGRLSIQTAEEVLVLTIVNIPDENPTLMTANLMAPIVLNQTNMQAMQVVLVDSQFATRTRLIPDRCAEDTQTSAASGSSAAPKQ